MKRTDLLGDYNLNLIKQVFENGSQAVLFHSTGWSEIELSLEWLAEKITSLRAETYIIKPHDKDKIKIDEVRQLLSQTIISPQSKRYFLIFGADTMQPGAQNALLKELEEPGINRFFFLFSNQINVLLPTIRSRCQKINLNNVDIADIQRYFTTIFPEASSKQLAQVAFIADRSVERWQTLLEDPKKFAQSSHFARLAKQIVGARLYEQLVIINQITASREQAIEFVNLVLKIQSHLVDKQPSPSNVAKTEKWLKSLALLQRNSSLKLGLLAAVL